MGLVKWSLVLSLLGKKNKTAQTLLAKILKHVNIAPVVDLNQTGPLSDKVLSLLVL